MIVKTISYFTYILIFTFILSCSKVPITGRKQLNIIPDSQLYPMSFNQYDAFLKDAKISTNKTQVDLVKKVGNNIKLAVEKFMAEKKYSSQLKDYKWEFNLVEDPAVNAWCMPGGKVVVYTGILPITQNEVGLAVVMGHEVAHAIAEHGGERMSQSLIQQMGGIALNVALEQKSEQTKQLWNTAYGVGTQVGVMLPFSRTHETEADKLGLIFMAIAGYDPNESIAFWQRMSQNKSAKVPEFLSTHPSDQTRINDLKKFLPKALKYYKK
jgi:predicted Zn-dependent protease